MDLEALLGFEWSAADESVAARRSLGVPAIFATPAGDAWLKTAERLADSAERTPVLRLDYPDTKWLANAEVIPEYGEWLDTNLFGWRDVLSYRERYDAFLAKRAEVARLAAMTERERELEKRRQERAAEKARLRAEEAAEKARLKEIARKEAAEKKRLVALSETVEAFYTEKRRLPNNTDTSYAQLRELLDNPDAFQLVDVRVGANNARQTWLTNADRLAAYVKRRGFPRIPAVDGRELEPRINPTEKEHENWRHLQFRRMSDGVLAFQSALYLEKTVPGWAYSRTDRRFEQGMKEYEEWVKKNGTPKRRSDDAAERRLADFASKWRIRLKGDLTVKAASAYRQDKEGRKVLAATRHTRPWEEMLSMFESFVAAHDRLPVRRSRPEESADGEEEVAVWLKNQRGYNFTNLTDAQKTQLTAVHPEWEGRGKSTGEKEWLRNADAYSAWVHAHGRLPLQTAEDPAEKTVAVWFKTNRAKRAGTSGKTKDGGNVGWNAEREAECVARFGEHWHEHGRSTLFLTSVFAHIWAQR